MYKTVTFINFISSIIIIYKTSEYLHIQKYIDVFLFFCKEEFTEAVLETSIYTYVCMGCVILGSIYIKKV